MTKPNELLRRAMKFAVEHPDSTGKRARLDLGDTDLCAQFAEQIVREIAAELDDEFGCECGAEDAGKRKKAGKMYNTESGHAIECPKFKIAEILRKFGLEP